MRWFCTQVDRRCSPHLIVLVAVEREELVACVDKQRRDRPRVLNLQRFLHKGDSPPLRHGDVAVELLDVLYEVVGLDRIDGHRLDVTDLAAARTEACMGELQRLAGDAKKPRGGVLVSSGRRLRLQLRRRLGFGLRFEP